MSEDLSHWTPRPRPERTVLRGRFVRLEPLEAARHGDDLFQASAAEPERSRWLPDAPPPSREAYQPWLEKAEGSADPLFFAVIDNQSGRAVGRQTLLRLDPANGVAEVGNILWGPELAQQSGATEALFLFGAYLFDQLGYRRFEWKCNDRNEPSKRAATRFGFRHEGVFRQHMVVKGENRDTAWYAMTDKDWPALKAAFEAWLAPSNFDAAGDQRQRLEDLRR